MSSKDWQPDPKAYVARWLEEAAEDGTIERRAERDNISYGDAMIQLAEELERPYKEIEEKRAKERPMLVPLDEGEIDRRARSYADKHGVSYTIALDAVIGTTPGSQRAVELEEAPLRVDDTDEAINHKAEDYARRQGVSFAVALEAVLQAEVA